MKKIRYLILPSPSCSVALNYPTRIQENSIKRSTELLVLTGWDWPSECLMASPVALLTSANAGYPSSSFTLVLRLMSLYQCCTRPHHAFIEQRQTRETLEMS